MNENDNIQYLYDNLKKNNYLTEGSIDDFRAYLEDEGNRQSLYDNLKKKNFLTEGSVDDFNAWLGIGQQPAPRVDVSDVEAQQQPQVTAMEPAALPTQQTEQPTEEQPKPAWMPNRMGGVGGEQNYMPQQTSYIERSKQENNKVLNDEETAKIETLNNLDNTLGEIKQKRRQGFWKTVGGMFGDLAISGAMAEGGMSYEDQEQLRKVQDDIRKTNSVNMAINQNLHDAENTINIARKNIEEGEGSVAERLGRGVRYANLDNVIPVSELYGQMGVLQLYDKLNEDGTPKEPLTEDEQTLYEALALNQYAQQAFGGDINMLNRIGKGLPEQAMFTLSFLLSSEFAGAQAIGKGATKALQRGISKGIKREIKTNLGKFMLDKALPTAFGMGAETLYRTGLQAGNIAEGAIERHVGNIRIDPETGEIGGFENGVDWGEAVWKSAASVANENATELLGDKVFEPGWAWLGRNTKAGKKIADFRKAIGKMGNGKVDDILKMGNSISEKAGWQGWAFETLEELAGNFNDAAFIHDQTWEQAFSKETLMETTLNCMIFGMAMGTSTTSLQALRNMPSAVETRNTKRLASSIIGRMDDISTDEIDQHIENDNTNDLSQWLVAKYDQGGWTDAQRTAVANYVRATVAQKAQRNFKDMQLQEEVNAMEERVDDMTNRQSGDVIEANFMVDGQMQTGTIVGGRVSVMENDVMDADGNPKQAYVYNPNLSSVTVTVRMEDGTKKQISARDIESINSVTDAEQYKAERTQELTQAMQDSVKAMYEPPTLSEIWGTEVQPGAVLRYSDGSSLGVIGQTDDGKWILTHFDANGNPIEGEQDMVVSDSDFRTMGLLEKLNAMQQQGASEEEMDDVVSDLNAEEGLKNIEASDNEDNIWDAVAGFMQGYFKTNEEGDPIPEESRPEAVAGYLVALQKGDIGKTIGIVDARIAELQTRLMAKPEQVENNGEGVVGMAANQSLADSAAEDIKKEIGFLEMVREGLVAKQEEQAQMKAQQPVSQMEAGTEFPVDWNGTPAVAVVEGRDADGRNLVTVYDANDRDGLPLQAGIEVSAENDAEWEARRVRPQEQQPEPPMESAGNGTEQVQPEPQPQPEPTPQPTPTAVQPGPAPQQEQPQAEYPKDKQGKPQYDMIDDPNVFLQALVDEWGEDALGALDDIIEDTREGLEQKSKLEQRRINKRLAMLEAVRGMLQPQEQTETPAEETKQYKPVKGEIWKDKDGNTYILEVFTNPATGEEQIRAERFDGAMIREGGRTITFEEYNSTRQDDPFVYVDNTGKQVKLSDMPNGEFTPEEFEKAVNIGGDPSAEYQKMFSDKLNSIESKEEFDKFKSDFYDKLSKEGKAFVEDVMLNLEEGFAGKQIYQRDEFGMIVRGENGEPMPVSEQPAETPIESAGEGTEQTEEPEQAPEQPQQEKKPKKKSEKAEKAEEAEEAKPAFKVGDEVMYKERKVKIIDVNKDGTLDLEYNPMGVLPVTVVGVKPNEVSAIEQTEAQPEQPKAEQPNESKWQYELKIGKDGHTTIERYTPIEGGAPVYDARWKFETDTPVDMLELILNLQNHGVPLDPFKNIIEVLRTYGEPKKKPTEAAQTEKAEKPTNENTIFTEDEYERRKAALKHRHRTELNIAINPQDMSDLLYMAGYHIERGVRKFADFCKNMIEDLGDWVRPYLQTVYLGAKGDEDIKKLGIDRKEWSGEDEVLDFDVENFDKTDGTDTTDEPKQEGTNWKEKALAIPGITFFEEREDGLEIGTNRSTTLYRFDDYDRSQEQLQQDKEVLAKWEKDHDDNVLLSKVKSSGDQYATEYAKRHDMDFAAQLRYDWSSAKTYAKDALKGEALYRDVLIPYMEQREKSKKDNTDNGVHQYTEQQKKAFSEAVTVDMRLALERGEKPYKSINDIRRRAESVGMEVDKEGRDDILLQELVEDGLVRAARQVIESGRFGGAKSKEAFDAICKLYEMQPTISMRSSNRVKMQQYSTPLPMAFVADMFAYKGGKVLEPTAGNGMLVFAIPSKNVTVNELDETRLANLREQGFPMVLNEDALTVRFVGKYDSVIANPPFGSSPAKDYDGKMIAGLDEQITLNALSAMKDDGRAAIIIGGNMEYGKNGGVAGNRAFWTYLYDHYNVKGVVDMEGKLYGRQGTTYPTRMILIDGRRSEEERAQTAVYPPVKEKAVRKAESFDDLYDIVTELLSLPNKTNGNEVLRDKPPVSDNDNPRGDTGVRGHSEESDANDSNEQGGTVSTGSTGAVKPNATTGVQRPKGTSGSVDAGLGLSGVSGTQTSSSGQGQTVPDSGTAERPGRGTDVGGSTESKPNGEPGRVSDGVVSGVGDRTNGVGLTQKPKEQEKRTLTEEKLPYRPHNSAFSLESVAPAAMVEAMDESLAEIEKTYGKSIDEFVRGELGYATIEELHDALAAEQVDSVAMAIHQMKQGQAMIIGDQTGVGKGRQMAALIRWAHNQGKKPIFITKDANLFSDIYRDLVDVGSSDLKPFIFNKFVKSGRGKDTSGEMVDADGNLVYSGATDAEWKKAIAEGKLPDGYDYAVLTYSQVNTGDKQSRDEAREAAKSNGSRGNSKKKDEEARISPKAPFLRQIAKDNYLLLDESHSAAGDSNTGAFLQSIVRGAKGVTFASATFAKRPDTMPLYAIRTAMSKANVKANELINIIKKGGVTLQEIMSRALTQAGQMVRRERDMSDVKTDWITVKDAKTVAKARENYDKTIAAFNAIIKFQNDYVKPMIAVLSTQLADIASSADVKKGTDNAGVDNVQFASKTYNYTKQLMLALKVDAIVDKVVAEIEAGRHPVIALESTMESFLDDYAVGDVIKEPTLSLSLLKGLDSVLQYTITDEDGHKIHQRYTPDDLGEEGAKAYYDLQDLIKKSTKGIFISPLDAIISKLNEKGYKVGELTGRNTYLEYDDQGRATVRSRTDKDKKRMQRDFNSGNLDVLILNKSASTGISLHASKKFSDQRQRTMVIAQPLSDINDYMQMIGRIDRTGQVHRGYYINLGLPVPAENRFLMMLATKLKSLNANTTTSQESESNSVEAPDLLNKYGSKVIVEYLRDNPEIYVKMGEPLGKGKDKVTASKLDDYEAPDNDEVARKITGRAALLTTKEQDDFYNDVVKRYTDLIKYLDDTGTNDLKITVMPLKAKTLEKKVSSEGVDPNGSNPFAKDAYVETVEMDVLRKPMKADDVRKTIEQLNTPKGTEHGHLATAAKEKSVGDRVMEIIGTVQREAQEKLQAENERYEEAKKKAVEDIEKQRAKINKQQKRTEEEKAEAIEKFITDTNTKVEEQHGRNVLKIEALSELLEDKLTWFKVGGSYLMPDVLESESLASPELASPAIFCGYKAKDSKITSSTTFAVFATLDGRRRIEVKLSDNAAAAIGRLTSDNYDIAQEVTLDNWDSKIPTNTRKTGYIMTGNILQAVKDTQDPNGNYPGQLVSYTDEEGNVHDGILMPDKWKPGMMKNSGKPINFPPVVSKILNGELVKSTDGKVSIYGSGWAKTYTLTVPKTKKEGGVYFENPVILKSVSSRGFWQNRGEFRADINGEDNMRAVVNELAKLGVRVSDEQQGDGEVMYRDQEREYKAGEMLPITKGNDGYRVEGLNDSYPNVDRLLDAWRDAHPDYFAEIRDGKLYVEPWNLGEGRTARERRHNQATAERQWRRAHERANDTINKLGLQDRVTILDSTEGLTGKRKKAKGWFDTKTGKIVIVMPNHNSPRDVVKTILHEGVAHYGLRKLVGEKNMNEFLDRVFEAADKEVRGRIIDLAMNKYDRNFRKATEEYLAGLAEDTNFDNPTFLEKVKALLVKLLDKMGIQLGDGLTDNELRYILWKSYRNLVADADSLTEIARDAMMQSQLGVGNYAPQTVAAESMASEDNDVLLREGDTYEGSHIRVPGVKPSDVPVGYDEEDGGYYIKWHRIIDPRIYAQAELDWASNKYISTDDSRIIDDAIAEIESDIKDYQEEWAKLDKESPKGLMRTIKQNSQMNHYERKLKMLRKAKDILNSLKSNNNPTNPPQPNNPTPTPPTPTPPSNPNPPTPPAQPPQPNNPVGSNGRNMIADEFDEISGAHPKDKADTLRQKTETFLTNQVNKFRPLKQLEELMAKTLGRNVRDSEAVYSRATQMAGRTLAQMEAEREAYLTPLSQAVNDVLDIIDPEGRRAKRNASLHGFKYEAMEEVRQQLSDYLIAKHGLERSEWFYQKALAAFEEKKKDPAWMAAQQAKYDALSDDKKASMTFEEYIDNKKPKWKDMGGLTGLAESLGEDTKKHKQVAENLVAEFEKKIGKEAIGKLWGAINDFNNRNLEIQYESGRKTKEEYEELMARHKYYVPLTGFDEETSDDRYTYEGNVQTLGDGLYRAKGRRSKPADPLVAMMHQQEHDVIWSNDNWAKDALLNAAINMNSDLLSVSQSWYVYNDETEEWEERLPEVDDTMSADKRDAVIKQFEADMKDLQSKKKAKRHRGRLNVGVRVLPKRESQHEVEVWRGGKRYIVYVNGNPSVVRAYSESQKELDNFTKGLAKANRIEAQLFTTYNPEFAVKNMMRDTNFALFSAYVLGGRKQWWETRKNIDLSRRVLSHLMKDGTVSEKQVKDPAERQQLEQWYKEFIENGGETGFTRMMTAEQMSKDLNETLFELVTNGKNALTKMEDLAEKLQTLNRWAENSTRFAAYITARQKGESVRKSMDAAKNSTLNFNIKGYEGRRLRAWFAFFNARLQGVAQLARLASGNKKQKFRFAAGLGAAVLTGAMVPFLNILLLGLFGDDDDWRTYENLSEFTGNNNLILFVPIPGIHKFIQIPYAQELAPFSAIGNIWFREAMGWNRNKSAWQQELEMALAYLPMEVSLSDKEDNSDWWLSTLARTASPTILQPTVEYLVNENFMNMPLRRDNKYKNDLAAWTRAYENRTSSALINASKWLNGGGSKNKWGKFEFLIDPSFIQHVVEGTAGGAGSFIGNARDLFTEPDWFNHLPFVRKFMFDSDPKKWQAGLDRAYSSYAYDLVEKYDGEIDAIRKDNNISTLEYARKMWEESNSVEAELYNTAKYYRDELGKKKGKKNGHSVNESEFGNNPYRKKENGKDDLPIIGINGMREYYGDLKAHNADKAEIEEWRNKINEYEMQMIEEMDAVYYRERVQNGKKAANWVQRMVDNARGRDEDWWKEYGE